VSLVGPLSACSSAPPDSPSVAQTVEADAAGTNTVDKLLVFVVENRSQAQMRRGLPWVRRLGNTYGHTTDFHGITHPSLPNYLAMLGGSTFGVTDDDPPAVHNLAGPSVFGEAVEAGRTARVYAESMTRRCQKVNAGRYAVRHNPWAYFADERSACADNDLRFARLAKDVVGGRLPDVGLVVPNLCHDAHDCRLPVANAWLRRVIKQVMQGPDWADGHLAIVITADEDDRDHGNRILTVVAHPHLDHAVVATTLDHYSLSRAFADVAAVAPLGNAVDAPSLLASFGLAPGRLS
jgi:phosphatidylinositol-3-phosphatase